MTERGRFIIFEGVGGSGKTTHVEFARDYLVSIGRNAIVTREPGGIEEAESIRRLIFDLRDKELINPDHQMALFFAARHLWINALVAPNIEKGIDVLSGRSYPTTGAYQGYAEGGDLELIRKLSDAVLGKYKPDAIVLLDISAEVARARNDKQDDPFDKQDLAYFRKIVFGYREMARKNWRGSFRKNKRSFKYYRRRQSFSLSSPSLYIIPIDMKKIVECVPNFLEIL